MGLLRVVLWSFAITIVALVCLLVGCSGADQQRIRSAVREVAQPEVAANAAAFLCSAAHAYDGKWPEAESALRFCSDPEKLRPWAEEAARIRELIEAQRAGK